MVSNVYVLQTFKNSANDIMYISDIFVLGRTYVKEAGSWEATL